MNLSEGKSGRRILDFYSGKCPDDRGRSLSQILAWDDGRLEAVHDYIQWIFPLPEPSGANPDAPVLDAQTIAEFHRDRDLQTKLHRAFLRMLEFYGLERKQDSVVRAPDFPRKSANWLQPGNHNYLRLTRILRSLRVLGLEQEAFLLFGCLRSIYEEEQATAKSCIGARTFQFWAAAVSGVASS